MPGTDMITPCAHTPREGGGLHTWTAGLVNLQGRVESYRKDIAWLSIDQERLGPGP